MKPKLLPFALLLCVFTASSQQIYTSQINVSSDGESDRQVNAVIYLPRNYTSNKHYPLVIFSHGIGEASRNIMRLFDTGLPKVLKEGYTPSFDFIMIAPQSEWFSVDPRWLPGILESAKKLWSIDESRIYLTGISAGGWCAYGSQLNLTETFAKKFAAIVINSGVTNSIEKDHLNWWKHSKTPVWAVVGERDRNYVNGNRKMVEEINRRAPGAATLTVRPGVAHGGWDDVYTGKLKINGMTMWEWLYQFKRGTSGGGSGGNALPRAYAGPNVTVTLPQTTVHLSGSGSEEDGKVTKYHWNKVSGPDCRIMNADAAATNVAGLTAGTYIFELTVTDNKGATGTSIVTVSVIQKKTTVSLYSTAGLDQTIYLPNNKANLNGSGTDRKGKIISFAWSRVSGPLQYRFANPSSPVTTVSGLVKGVYTFRLTVKDDLGIVASDKIVIAVKKR